MRQWKLHNQRRGSSLATPPAAAAAAAGAAPAQQTCVVTNEAAASVPGTEATAATKAAETGKAAKPDTPLVDLVQIKSEEEDENVIADLQAPCSGIAGSQAVGNVHRKPIMVLRGLPADAANEDVDSPEEDPDEQAFDNPDDEAAFYRTVDALGGAQESDDDQEVDEASVELEVEGEEEEQVFEADDDVAAFPTPTVGATDLLQTLAMAGLGHEEPEL
mmetsp:Transcript_114847/g.228534  ORF Transcript_114847/g.228534 Transcript_114847/m.228534 type:complete len:218 (-) Transcript_114847:33-686(-)